MTAPPGDPCGICEITRALCDGLHSKGMPRCCSDCTHVLTELADEIAHLRAQIFAVRSLCEEHQGEGVDGELADADTLWPSQVLAALDAPPDVTP